MTVATDRRIPKGVAKNLLGNTLTLYERLTFGASGAVTQSLGAKISGMTVTIVGSTDGRYTLQLFTKYKRLLFVGGTMISSDGSAFGATNGCQLVLRDHDIAEGANDGTILLQFVDQTDGTDRDPRNGDECLLMVVVETGNAK